MALIHKEDRVDNEAFVVDKNLGEKLHLLPGDLPSANADGEPVVDLSQEQKYLFDARASVRVLHLERSITL